MKVTMASERLLKTVVDEGLEHFICDDGKGIYVVRKDEVKIVQEWSHLYTFYANPKGPVFELRSREGPGGSIIIEGKVK